MAAAVTAVAVKAKLSPSATTFAVKVRPAPLTATNIKYIIQNCQVFIISLEVNSEITLDVLDDVFLEIADVIVVLLNQSRGGSRRNSAPITTPTRIRTPMF